MTGVQISSQDCIDIHNQLPMVKRKTGPEKVKGYFEVYENVNVLLVSC